jgi:hypothetical protein
VSHCSHVGSLPRADQSSTHARRVSTIAPLGLTLDDEPLAVHGKLIPWTLARDLVRPHLEGRGLGMDADLAETNDCVGTSAAPTPDPPPAGV